MAATSVLDVLSTWMIFESCQTGPLLYLSELEFQPWQHHVVATWYRTGTQHDDAGACGVGEGYCFKRQGKPVKR